MNLLGVRYTNLFLVFIIFIAHFFAPTGYLFYTHTMSELAGQGVPNAWLLTLGFLIAGASYMAFSLLYFIQKKLPAWLFWLTFLNGMMTLLLGVFPTSYDGLTTVAVNETVVIIHRYIAYASNLFTITSIIIHASLSSQPRLKMKHLFFLVFALVFSGFFILYQQDVRGIFQRLILLTTTLWTYTSYGVTSLEPLRQKQQAFTRVNP